MQMGTVYGADRSVYKLTFFPWFNVTPWMLGLCKDCWRHFWWKTIVWFVFMFVEAARVQEVTAASVMQPSWVNQIQENKKTTAIWPSFHLAYLIHTIGSSLSTYFKPYHNSKNRPILYHYIIDVRGLRGKVSTQLTKKTKNCKQKVTSLFIINRSL